MLHTRPSVEQALKPRKKAVQPGAGKSRASLWLSWTLATTIGLCAGGAILVLATALGWRYWETAWPSTAQSISSLVNMLMRFLAGATIGVTTGTAQWLILRTRPQTARKWVLVTVIGMAVGNSLFPFAYLATETIISLLGLGPQVIVDLYLSFRAVIAACAVHGAILGLVQWVILRRRMRRAGWWITANAVAWAAGIALILYLDIDDVILSIGGRQPHEWISVTANFLDPILTVVDLPVLLLLGIVVGAITAPILTYMLNQSPAQALNPPTV